MASSSPLRNASAMRSICRRCKLRLQRQSTANLSMASKQPEQLANEAGQTADDPADSLPRWARTPSAMRAPFRLRPRTENDHFPVNDKPERLDEAYVRVLGQGGDKLLPEEVKWLAVTHKSFDHGRRGFNDRLAFIGKRLVDLQTSLAMIDAPQPRADPDNTLLNDQYGRVPFHHPALSGIENVSTSMKDKTLDKGRIAQLAERYGLGSVVRWKPRQVKNLQSSGVETVLAHTMYAIVGALALQQGSQVAVQAIRQRILVPLGIL